MKPENLLLDKQGNVKLCDFGWSAENKMNNSRTTFCGTIEYMAYNYYKKLNYIYMLIKYYKLKITL